MESALTRIILGGRRVIKMYEAANTFLVQNRELIEETLGSLLFIKFVGTQHLKRIRGKWTVVFSQTTESGISIKLYITVDGFTCKCSENIAYIISSPSLFKIIKNKKNEKHTN